MTFVPFVILWIAMAVAVLALLAWRKAVSLQEDDNLHVLDRASVEKSAQQVSVAKKLDLIDKWGKIATVAALVYGIMLGFVAAWQTWIQNTRIGA